MASLTDKKSAPTSTSRPGQKLALPGGFGSTVRQAASASMEIHSGHPVKLENDLADEDLFTAGAAFIVRAHHQLAAAGDEINLAAADLGNPALYAAQHVAGDYRCKVAIRSTGESAALLKKASFRRGDGVVHAAHSGHKQVSGPGAQQRRANGHGTVEALPPLDAVARRLIDGKDTHGYVEGHVACSVVAVRAFTRSTAAKMAATVSRVGEFAL